jgi:hypothetical protein
MKRLFRNNYLEIDFYWSGIAIGFVYDDGDLDIILPLLTFRFKTYMYGRKQNGLNQDNRL